MIFLRDRTEEELSWAFRCKGCGEIYVIRPVTGAEFTYPNQKQYAATRLQTRIHILPLRLRVCGSLKSFNRANVRGPRAEVRRPPSAIVPQIEAHCMAAGDFQVPLISPAEFAKEKVKALQDYALLTGQSMANLFRRPLYVTDMIQQADLIGVGSLPIVILTGGFTGAVLALNSASTLSRFGSLTLIAQLVSVGMVTELGPVITGLMVAGRNSSGMASELGSMTVTEQIDAMRALGTDPTKSWSRREWWRPSSCCFLDHHLRPAWPGRWEHGVDPSVGAGLSQYWTSAWQSLVWRDLLPVSLSLSSSDL